MVDQSVVESVQDYLEKVNAKGVPVYFGVLYGSQARGEARQWSDIDLLVVSPQYDNRRTHEDMSFLWRLAARVDSRIEPIPVGERQFVEDDSSAIIEMARREGIRIDLAHGRTPRPNGAALPSDVTLASSD